LTKLKPHFDRERLRPIVSKRVLLSLDNLPFSIKLAASRKVEPGLGRLYQGNRWEDQTTSEDLGISLLVDHDLKYNLKLGSI
jgi:hypothetical protein